MARSGMADAARVARWAATALRLGHDGASSDDKGTLSDATAEHAARDLDLPLAQVRADWDTARLAGLVEVHGDSVRPGWRLRAWDRDDSAALRSWVALFDAWSLATRNPTSTSTVPWLMSSPPCPRCCPSYSCPAGLYPYRNSSTS